MEIPIKYIIISVIIIVVLIYITYNTAMYNVELKTELSSFKNGKSVTANKEPEKKDNSGVKKPLQSILKKGIDVYARSNGLEEIPKFL